MTVWTTPKTWATGEVVTRSDLNTQLRDNQLHLKEQTQLGVHYEERTYTSAISQSLGGSWVDIVPANPTQFQIPWTPRVSGRSLLRFSIGVYFSVAGELFVGFSINSIDNYGTMKMQGFTSGTVVVEAVIPMGVVLFNCKPRWQCPAGRTAVVSSGSLTSFSITELGPA